MPDLNDVVFIGTPDWDRLRDAADDIGEVSAPDGAGPVGSDQHPVHLRHHRFRPGGDAVHRNILNNGYFVTDLVNFSADDRICIPVPFYHCFGMVMGNLGCTTHGRRMVIPAPASTRQPRWPPSSRNGARRLRRADDVHRGARPPGPRPSYDLSSLRTGIMAGSPARWR